MKTKEISCAFCSHARTGIFCGLENVMMSKLNSEKTVHHYKSGDILFYEDTSPLGIYCVHDGLVKLTKSTPDGRSLAIRLLGKGEIVGFRAVIANERYAATAEVVEPSNICIIPAETFRALLQQSMELKNSLIRKLAAELRLSEERMLDQAILPARIRVAKLLVFLSEGTTPEANHLIVKTRLQRQDLAEVVGITPQSFSRVLHQFNMEGIVKSSRKYIELIDVQRLQTISSKHY